ncbi:hypothetical protein AKO1_006372, partial [Acrasis kona]
MNNQVSISNRCYQNGTVLDKATQQTIYILHDKGYTVPQIMEMTLLTVNTVKKYIAIGEGNRQQKKQGRPKHQSRTVNPYVIALIDTISLDNPFRLLKSIQAILKELDVDISISEISRIKTSVLGYRMRKATKIARKRLTEEVQNKRKHWRENVFNFDVTKFVYLDESHFDFRDFNRLYGSFKQGVEPEWPAGNVSRKSYSLIMAQNDSNIVHYYIRNTMHGNGMKAEDFVIFLEELVELLDPENVLILDNARIHHSREVLDLLYDKGVPFIYLPTYSPDYNPIEMSFAHIKANLRGLDIELDEESDAEIIEHIEWTIGQVRSEILQANTSHCYRNWQSDH